MTRRLLPALAALAIVLALPATTTAQVYHRGSAAGGGAPTFPVTAPAADNCAAVPYSFTSDTNTGVCSSAADTVGLITGGTERWRVGTTGPLTGIFTSLAVTSTDGVVLNNTTAATAGVPVQQSPRLRFRANVWNTTAVAANNTDDWLIESVPVSGTTPSGLLKFGKSLNGAATTYPLTLTSAGRLDAVGRMFAGEYLVGTLGVYPNATGKTFVTSPADNQLNFLNAAQTVGAGVDVGTDGTMKVRTRAQSAYAAIDTGNHLIAGVVAISATAPSAPVACTSPTVTNANGTAAFLIDVGTTCAGISTLSFTMPAATNGWTCNADSLSAPATSNPEQSATTTTSVTITNYVRTTGVAGAWADGADISISCFGR